jgi:hypothetical protein
MKKHMLTRLYAEPVVIFRSFSMPAIAALLTFLRSIREIPYIAPSAGISLQSILCLSLAASLGSKSCEEVLDGECLPSRPFSKCSMYSKGSSFEGDGAILEFISSFQWQRIVRKKRKMERKNMGRKKDLLIIYSASSGYNRSITSHTATRLVTQYSQDYTKILNARAQSFPAQLLSPFSGASDASQFGLQNTRNSDRSNLGIPWTKA